MYNYYRLVSGKGKYKFWKSWPAAVSGAITPMPSGGLSALIDEVQAFRRKVSSGKPKPLPDFGFDGVSQFVLIPNGEANVLVTKAATIELCCEPTLYLVLLTEDAAIHPDYLRAYEGWSIATFAL